MRMATIFSMLLQMLLAPNAAQADASVDAAKRLFAQYVRLESAFDPAVADLYADSAVIRNTRRYPGGGNRVLTLAGHEYKTLLRQVMPMAKARGDRNRYSRVTYKRVGDRVRITCRRYSELKRYTGLLTIIVAPDAGQTWLIVEEHSESRP